MNCRRGTLRSEDRLRCAMAEAALCNREAGRETPHQRLFGTRGDASLRTPPVGRYQSALRQHDGTACSLRHTERRDREGGRGVAEGNSRPTARKVQANHLGFLTPRKGPITFPGDPGKGPLPLRGPTFPGITWSECGSFQGAQMTHTLPIPDAPTRRAIEVRHHLGHRAIQRSGPRPRGDEPTQDTGLRLQSPRSPPARG